MEKMKCKSMVLTELQHLEMKEFPIPEIHEDDGLLRVDMVGVCGSDPGYYKGKTKVPLPLMLGHEIVGTIVEIGEKKAKASGVKKGDRVVVQNKFGCGVCKHCITGHYEECKAGRSYGYGIPCTEPPYLWGGYSEYLYLPPRAMIHKIDRSVPLEAAVLTTSVFGNAVHWIREVGECKIGETVVIAGPGQQGLAGVIVAKECGARVIISGNTRSMNRLQLAKEFGADYIVNTDEQDLIEFVREVTDGEMADMFMDVTGSVAVLESACDIVGMFGRVILPGLYGHKPASIDFDKMLLKQIKMIGVHAQSYTANEAAVKLVESRKYPLEKMVTHKFSLEEAEKAIHCTAREIPGERPIKCVILPNGEVD